MSRSPAPAPVRLPLRSRIEHAVVPTLQRVSGVPRWALLLAILALMLVGAFVPHGGVAILLVAVLLALMLFVTWPVLRLPERMLRLAVLALVVAVGIVRTL